MKYNKVWGQTGLIFENLNFEVHRIETKKGGFSSEHKHAYKYNLFFVEKGKINIYVWKNDYDLCDITELAEGEKTNVRPGEWHKFEAVEDSIVYEIYYTMPIGKDIERRNVGGIKEKDWKEQKDGDFCQICKVNKSKYVTFIGKERCWICANCIEEAKRLDIEKMEMGNKKRKFGEFCRNEDCADYDNTFQESDVFFGDNACDKFKDVRECKKWEQLYGKKKNDI